MSQFGARRHDIHFELIPENLFHCRSYILPSLSAVIVPSQDGRVNRAREKGWMGFPVVRSVCDCESQANCPAHGFALTMRLGRCSFLASIQHPDPTLRSSGDAGEPVINSIGPTASKNCSS